MRRVTTQKIGELGEDIACKFLVKQGFSIITRNYWKKWGEIDIVAEKEEKLHFVEVKTVSHEKESNYSTVSCETEGEYKPEDNVHPKKLGRMRRVIQTYLLEERKDDMKWQFDVLTVSLDMKEKTAICQVIANIVL